MVSIKMVHHAADALEVEGEKVTYVSVRKRLGCGSMSTIATLMAQWKPAGFRRKEHGNDIH